MRYLSTISLVLLVMAFTSISFVAFAGGPGFDNDVQTWNQSDDDNDEGDDNGDDDWEDDDNNNEIPLDGGLGFLAVAGAAYGVKRVRDNMKK